MHKPPRSRSSSRTRGELTTRTRVPSPEPWTREQWRAAETDFFARLAAAEARDDAAHAAIRKADGAWRDADGDRRDAEGRADREPARS